jgi:hypothetical protein
VEKTTFELGGLPGRFTGWHDPGDRWNGWANPLLDREESKRLARAFSEETGDGPRYVVTFDEEEDVFRVVFVEEGISESEEVIPGRDLPGIGHFYDWGHGWCWSEEGAWE